MRIFTFLFAVLSVFAGCFSAFAFKPEAEHSNYVVIGAFALEEHAMQFIEDAKKLSLRPVSEINQNRHLFYVYVLQTADRTSAFKEASRIRKATPFYDTWVYSGLLGKAAESQPAVGFSTIKEPAITSTSTTEAAKETNQFPVVEHAVTDQNSAIAPVETVPSPGVGSVPDAPDGGKNFFFKIITLTDQKQLTGDIDLIDTEKARRLASYAGNQNVVVQRVNQSGKMSFLCEVFGYRKVQKDLNFDQPQETTGVTVEGNQTTVPFELARLQKGDIAIMYNVYFYKDAVVMRPESKYEVTSLVEMMRENKKYRIKIHGHTNGGAPGKIISLGESKNFFSLTDTKEGFGSAKKLSEFRAEVIRDYLISEGIDTQRMEIKAWGGKRPVHNKNSPQAAANVRVEIEILDDK